MKPTKKQEAFAKTDPHPNSRIWLYSIGANNEAHGPALPPNTDDLIAQRTACDASRITGADYAGHIPFSSDRVGEIAKDWNHSYISPEIFLEETTTFIQNSITFRQIAGRRKSPSNIVIISGHGGNNFIEEHLSKLSKKVDVPISYVPPFQNLSMPHSRYGKLEPSHAGDCEHPVAAYLKFLDRDGVKAIEREAEERGPLSALEKWPAIMGLGGFVLDELAGPKYDPLREHVPENHARAFIKRGGTVVTDKHVGESFYEENLKNAVSVVKNLS